MDGLIEWLKSEIDFIETRQEVSEFQSGYHGALVNTLDYIQSISVYAESLDNN
jgi:hypothetical protein